MYTRTRTRFIERWWRPETAAGTDGKELAKAIAGPGHAIGVGGRNPSPFLPNGLVFRKGAWVYIPDASGSPGHHPHLPPARAPGRPPRPGRTASYQVRGRRRAGEEGHREADLLPDRVPPPGGD